MIDISRDPKDDLFLAQQICIAIQRGNATSLLKTITVGNDVEEFFDARM